jgi:hypothetical protein
MLFNVPGDWYGRATEPIRSIISQMVAIHWFLPYRGDPRRSDILGIVTDHLNRLRATTSDSIPIVTSLNWLEGHWQTLHENRWGIDPYSPWGDRWKTSEDTEAHAIQELREVLGNKPSVQVLFRPPLWPIPGQSMICGDPLIADTDILSSRLKLSPASRDWCVAWGLLCQAERRIWNALEWEVALGAEITHVHNPFTPLLRLYQSGLFPVGWKSGLYYLFHPVI